MPKHEGGEFLDCDVSQIEIDLVLSPGEDVYIETDIECNIPIDRIGLSDISCDDGFYQSSNPVWTGNNGQLEQLFGVDFDFEGNSLQCSMTWQILADGETFEFSQIVSIDVLQSDNPEDKINNMIEDVEELGLSQGNTNSLSKKLENAIKNITNEDLTDDHEGCEKLQSFIDQLNALVNAGKLTQDEVDPLIDTANECILDLCLDTA